MTPGETGLRTEARGLRSEGLAQSSSLSPHALDERGFTFIEIMIVLVVIGILLSLAQPSFSTSVHRAREATLQE
ncbi:MAG: prepilin-type N-terminal cleavage/methylation domain-containing protein, partial [candidate division NC10 bacterium]